MYFGGAATAIWEAFYPGPWALFYQAPIAFGITYLVLATDARAEMEPRSRLVAALAGAGGALVFQIVGVLTSILAAIVGPLVMWFNVAFVIDRYLDIDNITSHHITQKIMLPILLTWLIIGVPIYLMGL